MWLASSALSRQIFVLAAALELFSIISPLFLQLTVDKVLAASDRNLLATLGVGFMLLIALQSFLGALRSWTTLYFGTSLKLQWYANLFSHLVRLPVSFFEKRYFGDILSRFDGAEAIQRTLTNNFIETVLDGLISVFVLAVMFFYSRKLTVVVDRQRAALCCSAQLRLSSIAPGHGRTDHDPLPAAGLHD